MTTTLRPAEPEQRGSGGSRSRRFTVCVNSRAAGEIRLETDDRFGPEAGRVTELRIDEPDRRRGRAAVAVLAAEEVLRGWGCRRVEASVPAEAPVALRLAASLGYTERNRRMSKPLPGTPPPLPGGSVLRPMSDAEYPGWFAEQQAGYVAAWVSRGVPEAQALAKSEADHGAALPGGLATEGAALRILRHAGEDVGTLWVDVRGPAGYVFAVEVGGNHRGRGHGRTLMLAAERECLAAGQRAIALNVFADNTPALRLYESLGYVTEQVHVCKPLL